MGSTTLEIPMAPTVTAASMFPEETCEVYEPKLVELEKHGVRFTEREEEI